MPIKNFDRDILEPDGTPYLEVKPTGKLTEKGEMLLEVDQEGHAAMHPLKFHKVLSNVLRNFINEDLNADEYIARWDLMRKIAKGGDVDLASDGKETEILRTLLVRSKLSTFITGQICAFLNEA